MPYPTFRAVFQDKEQVEFLEEQGYNLEDGIDQPSLTTGHLAIHNAAEEGRIEIIQLLLNSNIDINLTDKHSCHGQTPLGVALSAGYEELAAFLIDNHADLEKTDCYGEFPLIKCARRGLSGDCNSLLRLANAGANLNQENLSSSFLTPERCGSLPKKHMTALMYAINIPSKKSTLLLIDLGATLINSQGKTIFDYCFDKKLEDIIRDRVTSQCAETDELSCTLTTQTRLPHSINTLICSYTPGYYHSPLFFKPTSLAVQPVSHRSNQAVKNVSHTM